MTDRVIILHNLRSSHNVGAIMRSAACFGDFTICCSGYTPYPSVLDDARLPHLARKQTEAIAKTALGAQALLSVEHWPDVMGLISQLKAKGYTLVACEQTTEAIPLSTWQPATKTALLFGNEPMGVDEETLKLMDQIVEIPMLGKKESLNVAAAAAIALYHWVNS